MTAKQLRDYLNNIRFKSLRPHTNEDVVAEMIRPVFVQVTIAAGPKKRVVRVPLSDVVLNIHGDVILVGEIK